MARIRKIREHDYKDVCRLIRRTNRISLKGHYPDKVIREFSKKYTVQNFRELAKERDYFVAEHEGDLVGVISIIENELKTFFVIPEMQGKGVGRKLFDRFEREIKRKGHKEIKVNSSPPAVVIYKHLGFKKIGEKKKTRGGVQYVDMMLKKKL